jgi:HEAT repeat protein
MALKNENLKEANEPKHCWRASEPLLTISAGSAGSDTSQVVDEAEIASLIEKLKNDDEREQWNIVNALQRIGSQAIPTLIKALNNEDGNVRANAASALRSMPAEASSAVPALIEALKDADSKVRASAAGALGNIRAEASSAVGCGQKLLVDAIALTAPFVRLTSLSSRRP